MLLIAWGVAPPAIVGDHKEQVGAFLGKLAHVAAKGRLVADGHTHLMLAKAHVVGIRVGF